jgi:hypothetical protein
VYKYLSTIENRVKNPDFEKLDEQVLKLTQTLLELKLKDISFIGEACQQWCLAMDTRSSVVDDALESFKVAMKW